MDYISVACDVLSAIEKTIDDECFEPTNFTAERFGVPIWLYCHLLEDLKGNGYIGGVEPEMDVGYLAYRMRIYRPYLTLKGAEFLVRHRPDVWMDA